MSYFISEKEAERQGIVFDFSKPYVKIYVPRDFLQAETLAFEIYELRIVAAHKLKKEASKFVTVGHSKSGKVVVVSDDIWPLDWLNYEFKIPRLGIAQFYDDVPLEKIEQRLMMLFKDK